MNSKEILKFFNNNKLELDIETLLELLFLEYKKRKECNQLDINNFMTQNLIKLYYSRSIEHSDFKEIISNYKEKYIEQESRIEGVHNKLEIDGLGIVYDFIRSNEWKKCPNIYLIFIINLKLYSLTPYPEAGGKIRNSNCVLKDSSIDACPYNCIDKQIAKLYSYFDNIVKEGIILGGNNNLKNENNLIDYINKCLYLKCELIRIHPFNDGNGRTMRALVNLLFKIANLPPIYVRQKEKNIYLEAMEKSIVDKDYELIYKFYYSKICDSILELDLNNKIRKNEKVRKLKREIR